MFDTIVQQQIADRQIDLEESLTKLHRLRIQSEVFTMGLLWERLFAPTYELIENIQSEILAGEWKIYTQNFAASDSYYLSIDLISMTKSSQQFVFDQFLEKFADSNTALDTNTLEHTLTYRLFNFNLIFTVKMASTEAVLTTLRDLGKVKTQNEFREYLTCDTFW